MPKPRRYLDNSGKPDRGRGKSSFVRNLETQPTILEQVAEYNKEPKARNTIKETAKEQRIREQKAANRRERNIAKHYLAAGPNIGNLAKAAYHWYNSVPFLGGQPEDGNTYITGEPPAVGIKNYNNTVKIAELIGKKAKGLAGIANWQGDAVALTKERLANGGFNRLSKTFNSNVTNEAINLETANPLLIKNSNLPLVYSPERRAALLSTKVNEVPSWYATGNPKHIGVSNAELGPVLYSDRPVQYLGRQASSDIAAHEYSHYVYTPNKGLSNEMFIPVEGYGRYFRKANSAEVQARGTQIKNYFGLKEGEPVTAEHLKYAAKHFVKDRKYDNGMTEFFKSIKDFDAVAKWITKNSPAYLTGTTFTYGAGNYIFNKQRPEQRNGGSIHISPSKRGTFTAAATKHGMGVQEFASRVLRNKEDYSPSLVKKANFARNSSKWH